MPGFLRQSTASQSRAIGPFIDDTDFKTTETGLTIANTDIKLVVNGAASANKNSGGGTHRVNGVYGVTFDATDTATVGEMEVSVVVSGALPVFDKFFVVEEAVYDALFVAAAPGYVVDQPVNVTKVGGTVQTAGDIMADTNDIQARLPAALVGGRIDASVGAMAANVLTATAIAADAITDAKVAADVTIASVTGTVGSVTGAVGSVTGLTASDVGAIKTKTDFLPSATAGAAGGLFIAGANAATSITTALTANITGNLSGSVGSVTGAVGSVTGLTASDVGAIKAKTDSLTFTVASSVDANIQHVNDTVIQGTGAVGTDEWRKV
jgi:hypothetical protein